MALAMRDSHKVRLGMGGISRTSVPFAISLNSFSILSTYLIRYQSNKRCRKIIIIKEVMESVRERIGIRTVLQSDFFWIPLGVCNCI